jgi:sugar phosphate isomerase/epimerase
MNREKKPLSEPVPSLLPPLAKSIATVSLSGTLQEKLEAAAAIGFDGVELFENDLLTFDGSPNDVRMIADGLGVAITLFQPFRDFEAMPEPQRARNLDRAERKFDIMQALGTWRRWRSALAGVACASATRRWPGAVTSIGGDRPGTSCRQRTTRHLA